MDGLPDPTEPEHSEGQDDLSPGSSPRHSRTLAALGEPRLAHGLGATRADRQALAAVGPIAPPMRALWQGGVGVIISLGLAPPPVLTSAGPCRLEAPCEAIGRGLQGLAQRCRPCPALGRRAKEGRCQWRDGETGRRGVDEPSPRAYAPGALWIVPRLHHGVGRVTGGGSRRR